MSYQKNLMICAIVICVLFLTVPATIAQNTALTPAGNAARLDLTLSALLWESSNRSATKAERNVFLAKLAKAINEGLAQAPHKYIPIAPCFYFTYQSDALERLAIETFRKPPEVIDNDTLALLLASRLAEPSDCTSIAEIARTIKPR